MGAPKEYTALQGRVQRPGESRRAASVLTDHLVRLEEERRGYRQSEVLGGLEVDDQLELRGLLDGEIRGLSPLENLVDVGGGAPKVVGEARPIGHETTVAC